MIGNKGKYKIEIYSINLIILLYLFRTAIPIFKYPFLLLYIGFFIYSAINYRNSIISSLNDFVRNYSIILILAIILLISFLLSNKLYLTIFKDTVNTIILLSLFIFLTLVITTKRELNFFVYSLISLIIFFAILISIHGILNYFSSRPGYEFFSLRYLINGSSAGSPHLDYNFALLPVFFGMVGVLEHLNKSKSVFLKVFYNLVLFIFTINIFISGSRRGLIALTVVFIILLLSHLLSLLKRNSFFKKISANSGYFILSTIVLTSLLYIFIFHTSYGFKIKTLRLLNTKNVYITKARITRSVFNCQMAFNKDVTYSNTYNKIWSTNINPKDPDSGWATRIYQTIFPLTGDNVEIVPKGAKGCLMDKFVNASTWSGNASMFNVIGNDSVEIGDFILASVYCYVSEDFNGDWVRISAEGNTSGIKQDYYDMNSKNTWQKLQISISCFDGIAPVYLYFRKNGVTDFSSLKGYVIFAYPKYKVIKKDSLQSCFNSEKIKVQKKSFQNILAKQNLAKIIFNSSQINFNKLKTKNKSLNTSTQSLTMNTSARNTKYYQSGLLCFSLPKLLSTDSMQTDSDPIRNWIAKLISEDTIYYPYKANIVVDSVSDRFIAPRTVRWQFARQIFTKEYKWKQKIIGNGFDFLNWYGYYFYNDKTKSDWPHNPFLSVLLYSGVLGLILYVYLMYKVFAIYIKYFKEYYILFIFFCITFFFSFFSAGSPFDPPVMGFFVMLPFLIDYIHKKDISN